jgi:hypothetical protein
MILWIESQPIIVIALLGWALCFGLAVLVFVLATVISRTQLAEHLSFVTLAVMTPVGIVLGLLLVFLSSRVWTNVDRANAFVLQEASGVRELVRVADDLPPAVGGAIRGGAKEYLRWVLNDDWPRMMSGHGVLRISVPGLQGVTDALAAFNTNESGQRLMQQAALTAVDKVREARRGRILLSRALIAPSQWLVVFALFVHVLLLIGVMHIRRLVTLAIALGIFSSAFAMCLILLMVNDRPFSYGGLTVEPVGLEDLVLD